MDKAYNKKLQPNIAMSEFDELDNYYETIEPKEIFYKLLTSPKEAFRFIILDKTMDGNRSKCRTCWFRRKRKWKPGS